MARYIDADELYKATQKRIAEANEARMAVVDDEFLDLINDAFTEDVAPRAEWISVDERLPEEGKYVIVWVGSVQVAKIEKGITEEERQKMKNGEVEDRIEYGWSQSTGYMPLKRCDLYKS